jgi:hypothetical protein
VLDPKKAGVETKLDYGVFLTGAGLGGLVDAVINLASFAEPLVFAGLSGTAVLGLKKMAEAALDMGRTPKAAAGEPVSADKLQPPPS